MKSYSQTNSVFYPVPPKTQDSRQPTSGLQSPLRHWSRETLSTNQKPGKRSKRSIPAEEGNENSLI